MNMKQLFEKLSRDGYVVERHDEIGSFRVDGDQYAMSISFQERNYCSNRGVDFGWAVENAEVHIWERNPPYLSVDGPASGVWGWQSAADIELLIERYIGAPS
jgi:hypothetical protein